MKKMISWNVNGLRACMKKGFQEYFEAADADIFCLQETKMQPGQADFSPEGFEQSCRKDRSTLSCPAIISIGIMRKRKDIPARPCLPKRSRFLFAMVSESKNMIRKAV